MNKWPLVPLSQVLEPISRPEAVLAHKTYNILGAHWYAKGLYVKAVLPGTEIRANKVYRVEKDDFVYNRLFGWKGSFAIASEKHHHCYVSNEFPCFLINHQRLDKSFLWYYFSRESAWLKALGLSTGGTPTSRNRLKEKMLLAMQIPLPPLEEQQRIVARIEALAAKVERAQRLRQKSMAEVEAIRKSKLSEIYQTLDQENGLQKLEDLIIQANYGTSTKCQYEREKNAVPVLRIPNIVAGRIRLEDMKYGILREKAFKKVLVSEGDILVVRTNGSADLVGRSTVIPKLSEDTAFASYLIRLRCDNQTINPDFLQIMLNFLRLDGQLFEFARTTAGQYNVSLGRLRAAKVPVPPLSEQRRIVAYLDNLQAKLEAVKRHQAATAARLESLLPSILDQAFRGEL